MPALLIIGGLVLLVLALLWLSVRAFTRSLLWGCASLLPPLNLLFVLRHWQRARAPVLLGSLGLIPLLTGVVMLANQDPQRLEALLSGQWLKPVPSPTPALHMQLQGRLNGRPFTPQQGELIDGVLRLREGTGFYAQSELLIRLAQRPKGPLHVAVLPADQGQLPEVEITWLDADQALPEARKLGSGYSLSLDLQPEAPNKWIGNIHLLLPASYQTSLSGKLELFSNGLRYQGDKVDRRIDSVDTLRYVIDDYLQRRFATRRIELQALPTLNLMQPPLSLEVRALVKGQEQQLALVLDKSAKRGWQVLDDRFPNLTPAGLEPAAAPLAAAEAPAAVMVQPDRRSGFSLQAMQANPQRYLNLRMRVSTASHSAQGRFQGLAEDGRILLRQQISGRGDVSYRFDPQQIIQLELLEP